MIEKHFLFIDDATTVGMKFDFDTSELTLGGLFRFRKFMAEIIERLLPDKEFETVKVFRNKVRLVVAITQKEYDDLLKVLPADGIVIQQTQSLQRVMR
jgi:hypothetical protein